MENRLTSIERFLKLLGYDPQSEEGKIVDYTTKEGKDIKVKIGVAHDKKYGWQLGFVSYTKKADGV